MQEKKPIYITKPFLPPLEEFKPYLEKIWESRVLTNNGPLHQQFEQELAKRFGVKYVSLFSNGTLALVAAIEALELKGEVITSPYSFVATSHSLKWRNIDPVFVDIDKQTFNIDVTKIEKAITKNTTAILPVHVYGNPCNVERINEISKKNNFKVIYDAAHAIDVKMNGQSILQHGDLSVISFHATKVFNTFEGGAVLSNSKELKEQMDDFRNFAFKNETTVTGLGINAKMNEFQAALGLLQLKYLDDVIKERERIAKIYMSYLSGIKGITLPFYKQHIDYNYSYFAIRVNKDKYSISRDKLYKKFKEYNIHCRRYFYPIISKFHPYNSLNSAISGNLINAENVSEEILCLPIYPGLEDVSIQQIIKIIKEYENK